MELPTAASLEGCLVLSSLASVSSCFASSYLQNGDLRVKNEATPAAPFLDYNLGFSILAVTKQVLKPI